MEPYADRIFKNARVYSVALDGTLTQAEAIAVRDGRILYVGTDAGAETYAGDRTIVTDCKAASVIPALVDAHIHLARSAAGFYNQEHVCDIYRSAGLGTVSGIGKKIPFQELAGARRYPMERMVGAYMIRPETAAADLKKAVAGREETPGNDSFLVSTVTYRLDNDDFAMSTPYTAEYCRKTGKPEGYAGTLLWDEGALRESVKNAAQAGFHIRITAHGDRAVQKAVDAILYAQESCKNDAVRYSISHLAFVRDEDRKRMAEHGIAAVIHPGKFALAEKRDATRKENVGMKYREAYPYGSLVDGGVLCAYGFMFDKKNRLDPFVEISAARKKRNGESVGILEAIRSATICGAYAFGLEHITGSIEPGKSADFLILEKDILSAWRTNRVAETVYRGNVIYSTRKEEEFFDPDDIVKKYRNDIRQFPKLSMAEEQKLAERIEKGDTEALHVLVNSSLTVALKAAEKKEKSIAYYNMSFEDMIETANVGLVRAAKNFRPGKGAEFATYAGYYIKDEIDRAIKEAEHGYGKDSENIRRLYAIENEYIKEYGVTPGETELAERMHISVHEVGCLRAEMKGAALSIDEPIDDPDGEGGLLLRVDTLISTESDLSDELTRPRREDRMEELLGCLTEDERAVIRYSYGIDQESGNLTYRDIAGLMKKSMREVMGLEASAKRKMMKKAKEMGDLI